jgi:diacylglycerol kinase (CTP)
MGLGAIGLVAGLVAGVAEALGEGPIWIHLGVILTARADVGSLDDNLTLPVVSGLCLYGFLKLMGLFAR